MKFWGSPEQKQEAKPVIRSVVAPARVQKSKAMIELLEMKKNFQAELDSAGPDEAELAQDQKDAKKRWAARVGRVPRSDEAMVWTEAKSNRKIEGSVKRKIEFGAYEKMKIADAVDEEREAFATEHELWQHLRKKFGVPVQRLKDIYAKKDQWQNLVKANQLGKKRGGKQGKRKRPIALKIRSKGAGRKREFQDQISQLKKWLDLERMNSHNISKRELLIEFCCLLVEHAGSCLKKAEQVSAEASQLEVNRAKQWRQEAENAMSRKQKLMDPTTKYGKNYTEKLISWMNAKYMQKEISHKLSRIEAKARAQLTYQAVDRAIWLMGAADEKRLDEAGVVAQPEEVIKNRKNLIITMSDQVPLWAKAVHKKIIFSEGELTGLRYEDRTNFNQIRREIESAQNKLKQQEQVIHANEGYEEAGQKKKKLVAGMKHMRHDSHEEKYRITYEARQKIYGIVGDAGEKLIGEVGKGLLVFSGPHQRLSNLDDEGKYIEDDQFQVGDYIIQHKKGEQCKSMKAFISLRKEHPSLFQKISVMQQPSSNLDSILMKWVAIEQGSSEPAGINIKDSFTANFAEEVMQCEHLLNQMSVLILGGMTAQLQVTDTDFARAFKHQFAHELDCMRVEHKKEHGSEKGFSIGYEQILRAAIASQDYMQVMNEKTDWVVKGAIRNGLIAYRATPSGQLQDIRSDEYLMGSKRIPDAWLEHRYAWLKDGVPIEPDFNLSNDAAAITDLIEWSNANPKKEPKNDNDEGSDEEEELAIKASDQISDELLIPMNNSLFFQLSPELRRSSYRRALLDSTYSSMLQKHQEMRQASGKRSIVRMAARRFLSKKLISSMSKMEALHEVVPKANSKKKLGKRIMGAAIKVGKNKPSLKLKPSIKKKVMKKAIMKKLVDDEGKAVLKDQKAKLKEAPPLPPPSEPPPPEVPSEVIKEHPKVGSTVRVIKEQAGISCYGKTGSLSDISGSQATIFSAQGSISTNISNIVVENPEWKPPAKYKTLSYVTRKQLQAMLDAAGCIPQPWVDDHHPLFKLEKDKFLEDQHMVAAWQFMHDQLQIPNTVQLLDPVLTAKMALIQEDADLDQVKAHIVSLTSGVSTLLIPIQAAGPHHWTLLIREEGTWSYFDSLKKQHQACSEVAQKVMSLIEGKDSALPARHNAAFQKDAECGFFVLAFMEEVACRSTSGPASRSWPADVQKEWQTRLAKLLKLMETEAQKLIKDKENAEKRAESLSQKQEKLREQAKQKLSKLKDHKSASAIAAIELLYGNSKYFTVDDLSQEACHEILLAESRMTQCAKCRYSSGCLKCDSSKALSYWMRKEADKVSKVPKWQGPGLEGWW